MFSICERNPFNDGRQWYYVLKGPIEVMDAHSLSNIATHPPPPPPSLTICLIFATRTIFYTRSGSISDYMTPQPTESKIFTMDINSFTNQFSASEAINSMFMNTMTGRSFSPERRLWLATTISQTIRLGIFTLDADHFFHLEEIEQAEEHFRQDLQEESSFEDHEVEEFYEDVQYLSFCPAPPALVESLKSELYQSDQQGEAEKCMICLEELVARVDQVKRLPCSHCFHVHRIDAWFLIKDTCPLCRTMLQAQRL